MQLDEARNSYNWGLSSKHVAILYVSETMFAFVEEKEEVCFFFQIGTTVELAKFIGFY